jgi:O-antigen ligase
VRGHDASCQPAPSRLIERIPGFTGLAGELSDRRAKSVQILLLLTAIFLVVASNFFSPKDVAKIALVVGVTVWAFFSGNIQRNLIVAYLVSVTLPIIFFRELLVGRYFMETGGSDLFIVLIFLPWVLGLYFLQRKSDVQAWFAIPIAILFVAAVISLPLASQPRLGLMLLTVMAGGGVSFLFIAHALRTRRDYDTMALAFIAVALYFGLYGIIQFRTGSVQPFTGELTLGSALGSIWGRRVRATLSSPNGLAGLLVVAIPLVISRIARGTPRVRFFFLAALVLLIAALTVTFSRNGYVSFMVSAMVMAFLFVRGSRDFKAIAGIGIAGLMLTAFALLKFQPGVILRLVSIRYFMYDPASVLRLSFWKAMIQSFLAHPFTGIGLANFGCQPFSRGFLGAHNIFFNTMGETGMLGLIGLVSIVVAVAVKLTQVYSNSRDFYTTSESIGMLGSWTALVMNGLFDNIWNVASHTREVKYIWVFLALVLVFVRNELPQTARQGRPGQ